GLLHLRPIPDRQLWNNSAINGPHSALSPANFTTLPHFSLSWAISLPKSAGEPVSAVPPRSPSRALSFGSASAALTSLFSLSTISTDVFLGPPMPCQALV